MEKMPFLLFFFPFFVATISGHAELGNSPGNPTAQHTHLTTTTVRTTALRPKRNKGNLDGKIPTTIGVAAEMTKLSKKYRENDEKM